MASCLSTSPSIASLVVCLVDSMRSAPCFPVAAMSAAKPIVSLKFAPRPEANSLDTAITSFLTCNKSAVDVAVSPP